MIPGLISLSMPLLIGAIALVAIAYLGVCLLLLLYQNRLIFFPSSILEATPSALGLTYEDIWIPVETSSRKGGAAQQIHNWWIPADRPEAKVVLHLHGNGYNVGANLSQADCFHQLGLAVLMVDYRGYGQSQGSFPTEKSAYEDARAAWNYLTQQRKIPPNNIILFGHSLGGAIAIDLALEHPEAAGLIVQSSFTSMEAMVKKLGQFWMFPVNLILTHRFDSLSKVRSLRLPVLYVHGTEDSLIPVAMGRALYEASSEPKFLTLIAGAEHNDVPEVGGNSYLQALKEFIEKIHA